MTRDSSELGLELVGELVELDQGKRVLEDGAESPQLKRDAFVPDRHVALEVDSVLDALGIINVVLGKQLRQRPPTRWRTIATRACGRSSGRARPRR